jgi:hypothetical protein
MLKRLKTASNSPAQHWSRSSCLNTDPSPTSAIKLNTHAYSNLLTFQNPVVTTCTTYFNNHKLLILPTECIREFRENLKSKRRLFPWTALNWRFNGALKMETTCSSETLSTYKSTYRYNPKEQHGRHLNWCENLKSHIDFFPEVFKLCQSSSGFITFLLLWFSQAFLWWSWTYT